MRSAWSRSRVMHRRAADWTTEHNRSAASRGKSRDRTSEPIPDNEAGPNPDPVWPEKWICLKP